MGGHRLRGRVAAAMPVVGLTGFEPIDPLVANAVPRCRRVLTSTPDVLIHGWRVSIIASCHPSIGETLPSFCRGRADVRHARRTYAATFD
jgi:hypothetical protein